MEAVILKEPGVVVIEKRTADSAAADEVLVQVVYGGICGSDVHGYLGTQPFISYPRILGHEVVGRVVESRSNHFSPGDRVAVDPVFSCGSCYACRVGRSNVCRDVAVFGVHRDGGFQQLIKLPADNLHRLPDEVSFEQGIFAEPLSIGFEATTRSRVAPSDTVTVIGAGTIGLMVACAAKHFGARVIIADVSEFRTVLAEKLGADRVVNVSSESLSDVVDEETGGEGSSVVIEAVGSDATINQSLELVSAAGRVVILGLTKKPIPLPMSLVIKKEIDLLGSRLNNRLFPQVLRLLAEENLDTSPLITDILPFSEAPKAFAAKAAPQDTQIKTLLRFDS